MSSFLLLSQIVKFSTNTHTIKFLPQKEISKEIFLIEFYKFDIIFTKTNEFSQTQIIIQIPQCVIIFIDNCGKEHKNF